MSLGRCLLLTCAIASTLCTTAPAQDHWVGTWATSPFAAANKSGKFGDDTTPGQTLRQMVHISIGGPSVRVVLTNEFGVEPLTISAATVALSAGAGAISGTAVPVLFNGKSSIVIPPGAMVVSDAAALKVAALSDVAVSLYLPNQPLTTRSYHGFGNTTNYQVGGNAVSDASLTGAKTFTSWEFLKGLDVMADKDADAVVTFGDSITDGAHSTKDKNARWPDVLAARLAADKKTAKIGVLNEGIGGNRILHDTTGPSALARFDRDVIALSGVKYVVILEGINDIGHAYDTKKPYDMVTLDDLIQGYEQMIARAHLHGIKVIGATLTPYRPAGYSSDEGEKVRSGLNDWIRTTKDLDGVVDFDKVTRDPANVVTFLPAADSGDHLHPADGGYKIMGDSIDLKLFTK